MIVVIHLKKQQYRLFGNNHIMKHLVEEFKSLEETEKPTDVTVLSYRSVTLEKFNVSLSSKPPTIKYAQFYIPLNGPLRINKPVNLAVWKNPNDGNNSVACQRHFRLQLQFSKRKFR